MAISPQDHWETWDSKKSNEEDLKPIFTEPDCQHDTLGIREEFLMIPW